MKDCIFCKIVNKKVPSSQVYEDDMVIAFMDVQPVNAGHILIVPKKHAKLINDLDDNTVAHLAVISKKLNGAIRSSGLKVEAINHFMADGEVAGQEVAHVHLHVFPRFKNDGFGLKFPDKYSKLPPRSDLEKAAKKIKAAL